MKTQRVWFVFGPKGAIYRDCTGDIFSHETKRGCIIKFVWNQCYGGRTHEEVWDEYQALGYTCRRIDVTWTEDGK